MAPPLVLPPSPPLPPIPSTPPPPHAPSPSTTSGLARSGTVRPSSMVSGGGHARGQSLASLAEGRAMETQGPLAGPSASSSTAGAAGQKAPTRLDLHLLPNPPSPLDLSPFLSPLSPLSPLEKQHLFTSVYLRAASAGNADMLEWLLALPLDPGKTREENAMAQRRFSLTAAQLANSSSGVGLGLEGGGGGGGGMEALPDAAPRKWVNLEATDEEGNTALGLCVALGHAEAVRVLVEGGVRVNQGDRVGWTPLHWAVQNNDLPIAAYLLNHRASPLIASHKGLTPRDLGGGRGGREGQAMRSVLESAWEAEVERERERAVRRREEEEEELDGGNGKGKERDDGRSSSRLSLASLVSETENAKERERERELKKEREKELRRRVQLGVDSAVNLEVELGVLGLEDEDEVRGEGGRRGLDDDDPPSSPTDSDSDSSPPQPFDWTRCLPDQMLVFALTDLPTLFDVIITTIKPVRERKYRVIPANVLFLCARFAHYYGNEELLEELMIGAMERIEMAVHNRPDDMANCAFWLSNTLLLLYYLRKDPSLSSTASVAQTYQTHLCDLINEIFVFVIRDAERRIDRVLEAALLEHEALPGFEDVAFEDEWASTRFVKKLTGRGLKKGAGMRTSQSARSLFAAATGDSSSSSADPTSSSSTSSSFSPPPRQRHVSASQIPLAEATPRSITALLSSTLFVLQLYEIPPSIVVQAFSQLFYWIACEVFNRLLTQRKYLCRSRAMQIRLNASNLEDWARANRLPTKMVSVHFTPLNQLLQWLQCLSSESSIDGLIGTVQSLRSLNPMQLRKAVREYRYEVDESRMDEDCAQYLVQIQKQWERMRMQRKVEGISSREGSGSVTPVSLNGLDGGGGEPASGAASPAVGGVEDDAASIASAQEDVVRMIDDVFADPSSFGSYTPPGGAEALGELLNSRYMLPFAVPTSAEMLVNFDQPDAFGPFASTSASNSRNNPSSSSDGHTTPRSSSRLSYSSTSRLSTGGSTFSPSTNPNNLPDDSASIHSFSTDVSVSRPSPAPPEQPKEPFTPVLPDDFFAVWDAAKAKAGHQLRPSTSAALLAGVSSWEESPAVPWVEWKAAAEGAHAGAGAGRREGEEDEEEDAGSVVDYGAEESEAGTSFESEEGAGLMGVDETPRQRTGFQS